MSDEISQTKEDYIRAIYVLEQKLERNAKLKEIASYLNLKKSTVSERLTELHQHGLVIKERYGPIQLTKTGLDVAERLTWKHRLIEFFLHQILNVPIDQIHEEAHKLEHSFSDDIIMKLYEFLTEPEKSISILNQLTGSVPTCPHGQELPKVNLSN